MRRLLKGLDALLYFLEEAIGDMLGKHHLARGGSSVCSGRHDELSRGLGDRTLDRSRGGGLEGKDCSLIDKESGAACSDIGLPPVEQSDWGITQSMISWIVEKIRGNSGPSCNSPA